MIDTTITFLISAQVLGALVGVVMTIAGEMAYVKAMKDGRIDAAERGHLDYIGHSLKFGLSLLLLASLGLTIIAYVLHRGVQPALTANFWELTMLSLIVIAGAWALSRKKVPFALGSAALFTAWWFVTFLLLGKVSDLSFGAVLASYLVIGAIIYMVLHYARLLFLRK